MSFVVYLCSPHPDASSYSIKITGATEEPLVDLQVGELVISTPACDPTITTVAPTMMPIEQDGGTTSAATSSWMASPINTLFGSLLFMTLPRGGGVASAVLTTALWTLAGNTASFAAAEGEDDTCLAELQIEIAVPVVCPYNNFVDGQCLSPRQIADMAVQALFVDFDVAAAEKLLATDYIQHNPTVPTGAAPVLGFIPFLEDSGVAIETHRALEDGNLVAYHSTYTNATLFGGETLIGFDVFRVENGQVQEHWDNLQELAGPNPNGNTMVDGPTMVKYWSQRDANVALAQGFVNAVLVGGDASAAANFVSPVSYTQHNPDIADGLQGLADAFAFLQATGQALVYDSIELVVGHGNFVLLGSLGEFGAGNATAFYDLFRMEDGLIVEHWDVIQAVPPAKDFAHSNGKF